jgi:hypothetical protein
LIFSRPLSLAFDITSSPMTNVLPLQGSPPAFDADAVRTRAEACQKLVDDAVAGTISGPVFLEGLKATGATPDEAGDYIRQFSERRRQAVGNPTDSGEAHRPATTPAGPSQVDAATSVAWALLRAKVGHSQSMASQAAPIHDGSLSDEIASLLGLTNSKGAIPASVLAKAPHLSKLSDPLVTDPHLERTQELLMVYSPQSSQDILVNKAQFAPVGDPLPRTIWRKILLDHFVDFEKLFASMDKGYDHHDDPKDFGGGYALVKKDQAFSRRTLRSEADWTRVFGAWSGGVAFFFPHREVELREYRAIVMDLFRAAPANPLVAISFDVHVRDKYSKKPFHLGDRDQLNFPLLTQMLSPAPSAAPRGNKRVASSQPVASGSNQKRADIPCRNWSLGTCKSEVCPNRRKHGVCCVCGEGHRAKDSESCLALIQGRN